MEFDMHNLGTDEMLGTYMQHPMFARYGLECWDVVLFRNDGSSIKYDVYRNTCFIDGDKFNFGTPIATIPSLERVRFTGKISLQLIEEIMTCDEDMLAYHLTSPSLTSRTLASMRSQKWTITILSILQNRY